MYKYVLEMYCLVEKQKRYVKQEGKWVFVDERG